MCTLSTHDIVLIAAETWEGSTWRRRHHVAWSLARNNRVFFVEPPTKGSNSCAIVTHQGRNLYLISIKEKYPDSIIRNRISLLWIKELMAKKRLHKIAIDMNISSPLLWVYFSLRQYNYYNIFNEKIIVSDWYDMFSSFFGWTSPKYERDILNRTERIIKSADVIFAVSEKIFKDLKKKKDEIYYVPHGVDYELFLKDISATPEIKNIVTLKGPKIGYLGAIQYKLDFKMLNEIAEKRRDWNIVMAGKESINNSRDDAEYKKLLSQGNVFYIGEIAREQIPNYLNIIDVCLLPMKKTEWVEYFSPLKMWEYMASGKPIVAVDRNVEYECSAYVKTAKNNDDFMDIIDNLLQKGEDPSVVQERKNIARENSWDSRVDQMMKIIEGKI